jgi:hypothetical protein
MRNTPLVVVLASAVTLALGACSAPRSPTREPVSQTRTTGVSVESGPASPGDPVGSIPESDGVGVTSGAVASPMEGACPRGDPSPAATDLTSCAKSCRGMNDHVPLGSTCASRYASCTARCRALFPSPTE